MFHHIAMFRFKEDVEEAVVAAIHTDLLALPDKIEAIRSYRVGFDAGVSDAAWDLVVVAEFADEAGYKAYSSHPDHVPVVHRIRALIEDRAAIQTRFLG